MFIVVGACLFALHASFCNADLVSWYQFSGNANDSAGGNHGTFMGNAGIVTDPVRGQVASFDGNGDYVDCGNDTSLQITNNLTVALWFNSSNWTALHDRYNGLISKRDNFATALDWEMYYDHNHSELRAMANTDILFDADHITATVNQWHHFAFTKEGTSVKMYIDGNLRGIDVANTSWTTSSSLRIGTIGLDALYEGFNGKIDDVRIYNNALTQQEITQIIPEPVTLSLLAFGSLIIRKKIK